MVGFYKKPKEYKLRYLMIGLAVCSVLSLIILGALSGKKEGRTTSESVQFTKKTQEETLNIYSIDEEVKVGKSIWILRGVIDKGWVLKEGFKVGQIYKTKNSTDSELIGVILEFVNMTEITDEIIAGANIKFKGSVSTTLIDSNGERIKDLSSDEVYYVLPFDADLRLENIYIKHMKNPDLLFTSFYLVPVNARGFKVEVRDETTYSDEKALIDLNL